MNIQDKKKIVGNIIFTICILIILFIGYIVFRYKDKYEQALSFVEENK